MKAKNEDEFTYMRIRRNDLNRFRDLNLRDKKASKRTVPMHQTVGNVIDLIEKTYQL